jgi:ubiquinone/menaquinone biosynthesis C-methylase UbiE
MSSSDLPHHEDTSNTYIPDAESAAEMARLIRLDHMTTKSMGTPLAGLPTLPENAHVLDIACGPGGWVFGLACLHPEIEVTGIDISHAMISYANAKANSEHINNVSFGVMDATKSLDFADHSFDLINGRFLCSFLQRDVWPVFLQECQRVLRPGGILLITDTDHGGITNSPAFDQFNTLLFGTLERLGHGFSPQGTTLCITPMLERLFSQSGYINPQHQAHAVNVSTDAEVWADFYHNIEIGFGGALPVLQRMEPAKAQEIQDLYNLMLVEMQKSDFCGMWYLLSVWGTTPL